MQSQIDNIDNNKIKTIEQQVEAINNTISAFTDLHYIISSKLDSFQNEIELNEVAITSMKESLNILDGEINELLKYVDDLNSSNRDWATSTFATLEQYNSSLSRIIELQELLDNLDLKFGDQITEAIESMQLWVNKQFTKYYDIVTIDAMLSTIEESIVNGDNSIRNDITQLMVSLNKMKEDITLAYEEAIFNAIEENNGLLNKQITNQVEVVNKRIDDELCEIYTKIRTIEDRLEALENLFNNRVLLKFENIGELTCYPSKKCVVPFEIINGDESIKIESFAENGWTSEVELESVERGTLTVTASSYGGNSKVILFINKDGLTDMQSLVFEEGKFIFEAEVYSASYKGAEINFSIDTNLDYSVVFEDGCDWIHMKPCTKSKMRKDDLCFIVDENPEDSPSRTTIVNFLTSMGEIISSILIYQEVSPTSIPVEFADRYVEMACIDKYDINEDGLISYAELAKVESIDEYFFGQYSAVVTSFEEFQYFVNLKEIPSKAFYQCTMLSNVVIPRSVSLIGDYAFYECTNLETFHFSNSIETIGNYAFAFTKLNMSSNFPKALKVIGNYAFAKHRYDEDSELFEIILPEGLTSIGSGAFDCNSTLAISVPHTVTAIGARAFNYCTGTLYLDCNVPSVNFREDSSLGYSNFSTIIFENNCRIIGQYALWENRNLKYIVIGENVTSIYKYGLDCGSKVDIYCCRNIPCSLYGVLPVGAENHIYIPTGSMMVYQNAISWSSYKDYFIECDDFPIVFQ